MGKPLAKHTIKMMEYLRKHPDMAAPDVATKFNVHVSRIYQLKRRIKDEELTVKTNKALNGLTWTVSSSGVEGDIVAEQKEVTKVDAILEERGGRYGTFESNARTCQRLKNVLHSQEGWYRLSYVQREAVEMMMHKISRLVNGDATYLDTVVDISGYNQLMLDHMRAENEGKKME